VRAHNTIRARYVSSAYMMHGSETLYVTMLLQLFVRPSNVHARICTNSKYLRAMFFEFSNSRDTSD